MRRPFTQVNVFSADPLSGNPLAVVRAAEGLSEAQMAALARWTNLSETTFLLAPTDPGADYRVRIFTPGGELPFAGHPTLGSCHAWREHGGGAPGARPGRPAVRRRPGPDQARRGRRGVRGAAARARRGRRRRSRRRPRRARDRS